MSQDDLEKILGAWADRHEASVRQMGRLHRRYKTEGDQMHWHIARSRKGMGTVEVSYLPSTGMLTVLVHENRRGEWAGRVCRELAEEMQNLLGRYVQKP